MGLFKNPGGVQSTVADKVSCGEKCGKCGRGECTMNLGHNPRWHGHQSTGKGGCGHSWGGEHH